MEEVLKYYASFMEFLSKEHYQSTVPTLYAHIKGDLDCSTPDSYGHSERDQWGQYWKSIILSIVMQWKPSLKNFEYTTPPSLGHVQGHLIRSSLPLHNGKVRNHP